MCPESGGTYALILRLLQPAIISVGRLGRFRFPAGWYAYAGSAHGPGGLAARLGRHLGSSKKLHWHVDYLRVHACPIAIWYATETQKRECEWAQALSGLPGASIPVPRFGASDCSCAAHLVHFDGPPDVETFIGTVGESVLQERIDA